MLYKNRAGRLVELNYKEAAKKVNAGEMTAVEVNPVETPVEKPAENPVSTLGDMSDDDLKLLAKERKVPGFGNMKRETLIKKLTK